VAESRGGKSRQSLLSPLKVGDWVFFKTRNWPKDVQVTRIDLETGESDDATRQGLYQGRGRIVGIAGVRRGKGVTIISDLSLDEKGLAELATKLKPRLGTGGTVKDGRIEIQGDHRDRIVEELEGLGYRVKRAGG
jgi:predicted translation initiation factor SUI1